jgi:hypothetical protein
MLEEVCKLPTETLLEPPSQNNVQRLINEELHCICTCIGKSIILRLVLSLMSSSSKTFPLCDGSHMAHNKATGDNLGMLTFSLIQQFLFEMFLSPVC